MFGVQSKPGIKAVNLIKMDTLTYGVSYEVSGARRRVFLLRPWSLAAGYWSEVIGLGYNFPGFFCCFDVNEQIQILGRDGALFNQRIKIDDSLPEGLAE